MTQILYLSYDGLTDPLGKSQILPYLSGLTLLGYNFHVISFEKPNRKEEVNQLKLALPQGIIWHPQVYNNKIKVLSPFFLLLRLRRVAYKILLKNKISIVHCRSYLPALIGMFAKTKFKIRFLFDTRGFWVDERVEGNIWNINNPIYYSIYSYFKKLERKLFLEADAIVMLTAVSVDYLNKNNWISSNKLIYVIPCCVDLKMFSRSSIKTLNLEYWKERLQIRREETIGIYHGSLGTWYMMEEMILFFKTFINDVPSARLIIVTQDKPDKIRMKWLSEDLPQDKLDIISAKREEIPTLLALADFSLYFIKPSFSKMASSPTKLGEIIAMDLPLITNSEIGDQEKQLKQSKSSILINDFNHEEYASASKKLSRILMQQDIADVSLKSYFSLERGCNLYHEVYNELDKMRLQDQNISH